MGRGGEGTHHEMEKWGRGGIKNGGEEKEKVGTRKMRGTSEKD